MPPKSWVPAHVRNRILHALGPHSILVRCWYCEKVIVPGDKDIHRRAYMDHKLPVCRGGAWVAHNTVPCCRKCNRYKFTDTAGEFIGVLTLHYCAPKRLLFRDLDKPELYHFNDLTEEERRHYLSGGLLQQ